MKNLVTKLALIVLLAFAFQALTGTFAMAAQAQTQKLDPLLAALASLAIPGLGQLLLGDQTKAISHFLIFVGIYLAATVLSYVGIGVIIFALAPLWNIYSAYDAYQMASK